MNAAWARARARSAPRGWRHRLRGEPAASVGRQVSIGLAVPAPPATINSGGARPGVAVAVTIGAARDAGNLLEVLPRATSAPPRSLNVAMPGTIAEAGLSLTDRLRALLAVPLDSLLPGPDSAIDWPFPLHEYQIEGVKALLASPRLLLADDMGLGKTVQAAAAVRILCLRREMRQALLVVPASLLDQWRRELRRWAPELRVLVVRGTASERAWQWRSESHVTIVGYETLRSDAENPAAVARTKRWDLVILDEAQKIKNPDSSISRVCKSLQRERSWAMTGTPLENKLEDLASILEFVDHDPENPGRRYGSGTAMLERHRELQLRRRKVDVLTELPPKQVVRLAIPLGPTQQAAYDRAEREGVLQLQERGAEVRIQHVLELILRLKQLCNFCPSNGESAKIADIGERMDTLVAAGHRALLFSQFTDQTFGIAAAAKALARFHPLVFTGALRASERDSVVEEFRSRPEHQMLALSLRAGGVGLNLQEASYVFHLDRWWNPAIERQAEDRAHRMGQQFPVTVFTYTAQGTIEERIDEIIASKQQLFDEIVDDVTLDLGGRLTAGELFGLFGMAPGQAERKSPSARPPGLELEDRCSRLLERRGWAVARTPLSRDGGVDLIATRTDEVGLDHRLFVECKDHARPVGVEVVRALLGVLPPGEDVRPILAAPSGVTTDAARLASARGVAIWDEQRLSELEGVG